MRHRSALKRKISALAFAVFLLFFMALPALSEEAAITQLSDTTFQETSNKRTWHLQRSKRFKTADDAISYLENLNQGEFNDWRLPTKKELFELFSIFDLKQHGTVKIRMEGTYWLTDNKRKIYAGAWEIGDQCGPSRTFYTGKAGYVRAVRQ
ncbi:MAG: hypothetical protein ACI8ZB_005456 [Desulforhopalus sp.]|jgi:hypothetical protein